MLRKICCALFVAMLASCRTVPTVHEAPSSAWEVRREEVARRMGLAPPLGSLRYWILGVPEPGHPAKESVDSQQRLSTLQQDGWQIQYTDYMSVGGEWLPSKLTLQRQGVRLRVVVDGWNS